MEILYTAVSGCIRFAYSAAGMCGANPALVDVDSEIMNIAPQAFNNAITDRTKAVITVHVSGRAADRERY